MNTPLRLTYSTAFQILGRGATAFSTALVTFLVTRSLGVNGFGNFTAILSYITLFFVFTDFGINAIFVREVSNEKSKQKDYYKNLLGLRLIGILFTAFIAIGILAFSDHSGVVKLGIILGLGILVAQSFAVSALAVFQAKIRYDQALISDVFGAVANLMFVYIATKNFSSVLAVIIALVFGNFVRALVALYLAKFQIGVFAFAFNINFWRKLIFAALPIGLIMVFSQFNAQIDKQIVLLATYKPSLGLTGETSAGIYGLAYKIFELAIVLPTYILNVGYPLMIRKKDQGLAVLLKFAKKLAIVLVALGGLGLVCGLVFAPLLVSILGGSSFSDSILTTRILFLGFPLFFITPLTLWLGVVLNKNKELLFIYGFAAVFNLVANLVFVPEIGYNAAAVITVTTEGLILVMSFVVIVLNKSILKQ